MPIAQPLATKELYGCGIPLAGASRRRAQLRMESEYRIPYNFSILHCQQLGTEDAAPYNTLNVRFTFVGGGVLNVPLQAFSLLLGAP